MKFPPVVFGAVCLVALVAATGVTPGPIPQKRVEGTAGSIVVYNDGGSYGISSATSADVQLFVNNGVLSDGGTGIDTNACTDAGAPCLTLQGALNKPAKMLRNRLTVSMSAGSYAGATVSGFVVDPSVQKTTAGILIDGALVNSTLTTGSATGTATSATVGSNSTFGTLSNTGEVWTADNLKGKLIVTLTGTGLGQTKRITTNTSTVVTIAGTWSPVPDATTTYAIKEPSVIINSPAAVVPSALAATSVSAAGLQFLDNNTMGSTIAVRNITVTATSGINAIGPQIVELLQVRTTSSVTANTGSTINATTHWFEATCASTAAFLNSTGSLHGGAMFCSQGSVCSINSSQTNVSSSSGGMNVRSGSTGSFNNSRVNCASAASSYGLLVGPSAFTLTGPASGIVTVQSLDVTNCAVGILVTGAASSVWFGNTSVSLISGNALTYGILANNGAFVGLGSAVQPTITGATAEIGLDSGAVVAPFSTVATIGQCATNLSTGSKVCKL